MNKLYALFLAILITACAAKKDTAASRAMFLHADSLIKDKDFFTARDYVQKNKSAFTDFHSLVLQAYISTVFNRPAVSNQKIGELFSDFSAQLEDSLKLDLLSMRQSNHARLYEYANADAVMKQILKDYAGLMPEDEVKDYRNTAVIWKALAGQPKQEITIGATTVLKMPRDKAGLTNLEVRQGELAVDFIFDTGANISTVTETTAAKLNMKMLDGKVEVGTITGAKIQSGLAICPEFFIGDIRIRNAVFLVFPDSALAFPQIGYQINGIIGFPVIEAFREIQITKNDEFIIPQKETAYHNQNMALDFLNPVININGEHYTFDTGATGTSLYKKYFLKHKDVVISNYQETGLQFGGAGGMLTKKGYNIAFTTVIEGKRLTIKQVQLFTENIGDSESHFYGNIGQDVIEQFQKMTINFDNMFIKFD